MSTEYELQRLKNIEANRRLLESLGLDVLRATMPSLATPVAKPRPKLKPKVKPVPIKRKAEEMDDGTGDGKTKIARRDDEDDAAAGTHRRPGRRSAAKFDYNEDKLADRRQKYIDKEKERAEEAGGYV